MTTPLNFNVNVRNTTQTSMKFDYLETFDNIFLTDSEKYSLSITGLRIPTQGLETFVMDNPSDYYVVIYGGTPNTSIQVNGSGAAGLPANDTIDTTFGNACNGTDIQYYSPHQFVDVLSRTIYRAYRLFLNTNADNNTQFGVLVSNKVLPSTSMLNSFTVNPSGTLGQSFISDISFQLSNISLYSLNTANPLSAPFQVRVQMPSNTTPNPNSYIVIFSCSGMQNINTTFGFSYGILLSEAAYAPFPSVFQPQTTLSSTVYAQPTTSFLSSFNNNSNGSIPGTWNFVVESNTAFTGSINIGVNIFSNLTSKFCLPPLLSLSSTTKKLSLDYQSNWQYDNMRIGFSPKLYSMIYFGPSYTYYNSTLGIYEIILPPLTSTNATGPITLIGSEISALEQQQSSMYNMMNLSRIVVKSSNLRCDTEYGKSLVSDNVISDFKVDTDVEYLGDLTYSTDAGGVPWRRYRITGKGTTRTIDLSFAAEYNNGLRRDIYIAPGLEGQARISFFKE